jgi:hypothetical protein
MRIGSVSSVRMTLSIEPSTVAMTSTASAYQALEGALRVVSGTARLVVSGGTAAASGVRLDISERNVDAQTPTVREGASAACSRFGFAVRPVSIDRMPRLLARLRT